MAGGQNPIAPMQEPDSKMSNLQKAAHASLISKLTKGNVELCQSLKAFWFHASLSQNMTHTHKPACDYYLTGGCVATVEILLART